MSTRFIFIACLLSGCCLLTGCGRSEPDPSVELRAFVVKSFDNAMADNNLRIEFDLEPPRFRRVAERGTTPEVEVRIEGVDRVIKGLDVPHWAVEKRDRVKGGGHGRIKLAHDAGDDGKRTFVFVYTLENGHWALTDHCCAGRGFVPEQLTRYLQLKAPSVAAVQ